MLTKEQILEKAGLPTKVIPVAEWGGDVRMRALSVLERMDLKDRLRDLVKDVPRDDKGALITDHVDRRKSRACSRDFLAIVLIDESGLPMFSSAELQAMSAESEPALLQLEAELYRFNGFSAEAVEDEAKKSEAGPSDS